MNVIADWIDQWGLTVGIAALIGFMVFIILDLAKQSQAGKFGTIILFVTLGMGIFGFIIKSAIQYSMTSAGV